ncbi:MAG: hypothetical protein CM15mP21_4530 [Hyphomicrobiales bacterium]|nr:MAG: hypothetical protein CM15mP21_4530 [Hyphomicrobiales bacterium]
MRAVLFAMPESKTCWPIIAARFFWRRTEPEHGRHCTYQQQVAECFVANGQNIYFHTGLILRSEDPNMVIGVIAHEIGHIIGGHLSRKASAINEAQRPALVATILGLGSLPGRGPGCRGWRYYGWAARCPTQVSVFQPRAGIEC